MKKNVEPPAHPHDTGYKYLLNRTRVFLQLLQSFVGQKWVEKIDAGSLTRLDKSFILPDFRNKELDLIYQGTLAGQEVIFYCLLELQSTVDHMMPYRLLEYMKGVWDDIIKDTKLAEVEKKGFLLPMIIPVVVFNGKANWTAPLSFREKLKDVKEFEERGKKMLDFEYELIRVHAYGEDELLNNNNLISTVFFLDQSADNEDIIARLKKTVPILLNLSRQDFMLLFNWVKKILNRYMNPEEQREVEVIMEKDREKGVKYMITNIERAIEKKIEEERKKYDEERKKFIMGALNEGLDLKTVAKITGLDEQQIRDIMEDD